MHKDLLCRASAFFKAAFDGNFKEANGVIKLPEQDVSTFKFFIHWLYRCRLRSFYYPDTQSPSLSQLKQEAKQKADSLHLKELPWDDPVGKRLHRANYKDVPLFSLVKLYILADALQIAGLQDHVISTIDEVYYPINEVKSLFWRQADSQEDDMENPVAGVNLAWTMTPKDGHLCALLLNIFCDHVPDLTKAPFDDSLHADFVSEAYSTCWAMLNKLDSNYNVCDFHRHDAGCPKESDFPKYT